MLVQATAGERCGHCGRALLIPLMHEVAGPNGEAARALARCARCGSRNLLGPASDPTAERRAAAISFVTRGASRPWRR